MSEQHLVLERFVQTVLNQQGDKLSKEVYEECSERCKEIVYTLDITKKTIRVRSHEGPLRFASRLRVAGLWRGARVCVEFYSFLLFLEFVFT